MKASEYQIQVAIVEYLHAVLPENVLVWHVPNQATFKVSEEIRKRLLAFLKKLGLLPGVPDLWIWHPHKPCPLMIEIKKPGNALSFTQEKFQSWCQRYGKPYRVCTSVDEVREELRLAGIPTREYDWEADARGSYDAALKGIREKKIVSGEIEPVEGVDG